MSVSLIDGHIDDDVQMTDEQIIKALECCSTKGASCKDCPAFIKVDRSKCKEYFRGAVAFINRQKDEIVMWQSSAELWEGDARQFFNERQTARTEAVKEFAERLKNEASEKVGIDEDFLYYDFDNKFKTFDSVADVIQFLSAIVVKEMAGDNNVS